LPYLPVIGAFFFEQKSSLLPLLKVVRFPEAETLLHPVDEKQQGALPQRPSTGDDDLGGVALTERELEVLRLLAQGYTYNQIAEQLVVSLNTVRFHVKGIYGKLGVTKVNQAIAEAHRQGLI